MKKNQVLGSFCCILAALIWGVAFVAQVAGMDYIGPFTFLGVRCYIGFLALAPFAFARHRAARRRDPEEARRSFRPMVGAAFLCGVCLYVATAFQQCGLQYTSVGKSGFITALYVILVPLSRLLFGHRPTPLLWGCVTLSAVGLWLLCMKTGESGLNRGDFLTLICALIFTVDILIVDKISPHFDPIQVSCLQFLFGGLVGTPIMLLTESFSWQGVLGAAVPLLYAGIMSSGVAYTLQMFAQRHSDPTVASILLCLESVFSVLAGWLMLHQSLSVRELLGCGLMFAAILLAQLPAAQSEPCNR